ncbi:hypothetical protein K1W69_25000 [Hoeflea sp. WL0058]|uniref:Pectate lyase superfamily protein domain-containing protein n=1 Tax=Flavimaribacter sediminis TaxID=2865987 RepID=A0AAE2ZP74_9HYPH|nr:hypothetical protein [Flavimaribacter sediminis]MBW8640474.1 hypothetical protein [Flavimaribacter sediminis]
MTISTTESRIRYSGDGATTAFSFPYFFEQESHLSVYLTDKDGLEGLQTIAVDYTVAGEGTSSGVVTFLEAPLATDTVTIIRDEPLTQATEVSDIGTFRAQAFESQFDRFARALQTLDGRIRRAPRVKASSGNTDVVLPEPEAKALLRWDGYAADLENGPTALDIENAEANAAIASEGADVALAASVEAAAHASSIAVKFFASRELAEATAISDFTQILLVAHNGRALRYVEDASAATPALTTADGRLWIPADEFITFDHFGAVADNATDCSAAMQAAIDYAAAFDDGATVHGLPGKYAIASQLEWLPGVSFELQAGCVVRAKAAMFAMLNVATGASNRIKRVRFRGGKLDANYLAERVLFLKEYEAVEIADFHFTDCDVNYIHLGTEGQNANNYEARIHDGLLERSADNNFDVSGTSPRGIYFDLTGSNSDALISDVVILGCKTGVQGQIYGSMISRVHPWSYVPTTGTMETAFRLVGDNNIVSECYADSFSLYGYHFDGVRNVLNHSLTNASSYHDDDTGGCVLLSTGSSLFATGNVFRSSSPDHRISKEFDGDTSSLIADSNQTQNIVSVFGDQGVGKTEAYVAFTTNTGADPTIETGTNINSITRNSDTDFSITFNRQMASTAFQVVVEATPSSYPGIVIPVIRDKSVWMARVQFLDETGEFVEPATVAVTVKGTVCL